MSQLGSLAWESVVQRNRSQRRMWVAICACAACTGCACPQFTVDMDVSNTAGNQINVLVRAADSELNPADEESSRDIRRLTTQTYAADFTWSEPGEGLAPYSVDVVVRDHNANGPVLDSELGISYAEGQTIKVTVLPDKTVQFSVSPATASDRVSSVISRAAGAVKSALGVSRSINSSRPAVAEPASTALPSQRRASDRR